MTGLIAKTGIKKSPWLCTADILGADTEPAKWKTRNDRGIAWKSCWSLKDVIQQLNAEIQAEQR